MKGRYWREGLYLTRKEWGAVSMWQRHGHWRQSFPMSHFCLVLTACEFGGLAAYGKWPSFCPSLLQNHVKSLITKLCTSLRLYLEHFSWNVTKAHLPFLFLQKNHQEGESFLISTTDPLKNAGISLSIRKTYHLVLPWACKTQASLKVSFFFLISFWMFQNYF